MNLKVGIILSLFLISFSVPSQGQQRKAINSRQATSENSKSNGSVDNWGFNYGAYFLYGYGQVSNDLEITKRDVDYNLLGCFLDVTYKNIGLGYGYETGLIVQRKSPSELNNTNVSGYTTSGVVRLSYKIKPSVLLSLNYKLNDKYSLANKNSLNQDVSYDLKSGYGVQLSFKVIKNFGMILDYQKSIFKYDSYTNDINRDRLGLGLVYFN